MVVVDPDRVEKDSGLWKGVSNAVCQHFKC